MLEFRDNNIKKENIFPSADSKSLKHLISLSKIASAWVIHIV